MRPNFCFNPRIIRSPWSDYYGREIEDCLKAYPDSYLKGIASQGYNGIWLHVLLREIVPSSVFPEFGDKSKEQLAHLKRLVQKAGAYGVKVYLYMCEPRGFRADHPFWQKNADVQGQPFTFTDTGDSNMDFLHYALCSSSPHVKKFLEESSYRLFNAVPGLGGLFCITASEHHHHCYSHYASVRQKFTDPNLLACSKTEFVCPRCKTRTAPEVVAEIIDLLNRGVKRASRSAQVIAWTWSWYLLETDPQPKLISMLPKDVILMGDWERGGTKIVCGKKYVLDEYSFASLGPSPRFKQQMNAAKKSGINMMAKIQIGNTHELASVPWIPVPYLLGLKLERMRKLKIQGYLGCWIMGGDLSPMSKLAGLMSEKTPMTAKEAIIRVAEDEFGSKSGPAVCKAWRKFSSAWRKYPFSIPFIYYGQMNYATAYTLSLKTKPSPLTASWRPLPRDKKGHLFLGNNLSGWLYPFTPNVAVRALEELLDHWQKGIGILDKAITNDQTNKRLLQERNLSRHIALSVKSTINIICFYDLLRRLNPTQIASRRLKILKHVKEIMLEEIAITKEDRHLLADNHCLGYHAEAFCNLYTQEDMDYKILKLHNEINTINNDNIAEKFSFGA